MPKRSRKPSDLNQLAAEISAKATGSEPGPIERKIRELLKEIDSGNTPVRPSPSQKDPSAVELGRKGGLKGGKARAEAMTAEQRTETAQKAAEARWRKK